MCLSEMKGCNIKPPDERHCNKNASERKRVTAAGSTYLTCPVAKAERWRKRDVKKESYPITIVLGYCIETGLFVNYYDLYE